MKDLPADLSPSGKTPVFTQDSVPAGLLKDHRLAPGYWGKIVVLQGSLEYVIQSSPEERIELNPSRFGVVEPEVFHFVRPLGPVQFYVEFLEAAGGAAQ
jgi:tellurite resistance-related uncharacterized protein